MVQTTQEGFLGLRERFICKDEAVYGTAVALTSAYIPGLDTIVNPTFGQGFQETRNNATDVRTINKNDAGPLSLAYNLQYYPVDWRMLRYVFDIDSETGSDPYTHTLSVGNTLSSFTAEWAMRHDSDPLIFKMTGNVINNFRIGFTKSNGEGNDGFVTCNAGCIAQNYTTPASVQAGDFSSSATPFQYRHSLLTIDGSTVVPVNNGEISFSQGINPADSRYASSGLGRTIGIPIVTIFRITGRFNLNLYETTYNDLWEAAAAISGACSLVLEQSASNKITFTFSGVTVNPVPVAGTNIDGVNTGDFVFVATGVTVVAIDSIANW